MEGIENLKYLEYEEECPFDKNKFFVKICLFLKEEKFVLEHISCLKYKDGRCNNHMCGYLEYPYLDSSLAQLASRW